MVVRKWQVLDKDLGQANPVELDDTWSFSPAYSTVAGDLPISELPKSFHDWLSMAGTLLVEWSIGGMIVGAVIAATTFAIATLLLRFLRVERE